MGLKSISFEYLTSQYNVSYPTWAQVADELQRIGVVDELPVDSIIWSAAATDEEIAEELLTHVDLSAAPASRLPEPAEVVEARLVDELAAELAQVKADLARVNDAAAAQSELDALRAEIEALKTAQPE